ncbi:MAG: radical SAM/SPASM domain-containing protein [Acidobacteria bacterium]|nr:radical SAM/SPASM domain-containing protein [Acidobacteriota bacterium]
MESIYYVLSWLCHRRCPHCYEDRFHPYYGEELERVAAEAREAFPRVIANLPPRMTFLDLADPLPEGGLRAKRGRIILAGGEILLQAVRESVLYPALELLHQKYRDVGGVELIVQTTGDLVTDRIIGELLDHHVSKISVSGLDAFHEGMETEAARDKLRGKLTALFEARGMRPDAGEPPLPADQPPGPPEFSFFGATPDSWIGPLWPRGRAFENELSTATLTDNFCNGWSGGLNFLQRRHSGSEVSIEPNGNVYPCCMKTRAPIGNVAETPLEQILDARVGDPVYEAISMGHPERMGLGRGWSVEKFLEKSRTTLPSGRIYQNLCVGCDRFHEEVLGAAPGLVKIASGS